MSSHRVLFTKEFKEEAVRLALTSDRQRQDIASDLGIGKSTLCRWVSQHRHSVQPDAVSDDKDKELALLRREVQLLKAERDLLKKATALFARGKSVRFSLIDAKRACLPVERACLLLNVSMSGYYAWKKRSVSKRQRDDMVLLVHIRSYFRQSNDTYGSPRMAAELQACGFSVGRRRVARLMKETGLQARQKRRFKCTTDSHHDNPVFPNLLEQDFTASAPDRKWGVDISYIWTMEGWLYLAVVIDLYARRVVGWATSNRLKKELALEALDKAFILRQPPPGLIHHSDRGSQYCSYEYRKRLKKYRMTGSMSAKGNCYDNAVVETFFKTIKTELVWRTSFATRKEATNMIAHYIGDFYNPRRRHSTLGYLSPIQFEKRAA
nr:IS3 family transposase [Kordiimonas pumila]